MQTLYVPTLAALTDVTPFARHMEPLLARLDAAGRAGHAVAQSRLCQDYLQVCRWPFRQLEYSYALEAVAQASMPPGRALDAGSGITPFGHALAGLGWQVTSCDFDGRLMANLAAADMAAVYGTAVTYEQQDLTRLRYPDQHFDLVTCVSVVEHIGAPHDRAALNELRRVLKPGGQLILTVDFEPPFHDGPNEPRRLARRARALLAQGDVAGLWASVTRKWQARRMVAGGTSHDRTPNQCFQLHHLQNDIAPLLADGNAPLDVPYAHALDTVKAEAVPAFWNLVPGLFDVQGRRLVLPAVARFIKPS